MKLYRDADGHTALALQASLSILIALGLWNATAEWSPILALWSVGRPWWLTLAPRALVVALFLCALAMSAGVRVRVAALTLAALAAALYALAPAVYHNNYYLLWLVTLALAMAPHPDHSVARVTAAEKPSPRPWPPALAVFLRAQVTIVYWVSVAVKLSHPMWGGTGHAIQWITTTRAPDSAFGLVNPLLRPLLSRPVLAALSEWAIVGLELCLPLLLFNPRTRRSGVALGAAMHVVMQEWLFPQVFSFVMLLGYFAFIEGGDRAFTVRFDPRNSFDRALAAHYPRVDWMGRTRWLPLDTPGPLALDDHGVERRELAALRVLVAVTPATVLAYAALALLAPGADTVLTLPRAAVENLLVAGVSLGFIPGLLDRPFARLRRALDD